MSITERELALLNRALEGALSRSEEEEFHALLSMRPELQEEYRSLKKVKEVTMELKLKHPPEETWDRYWVAVYSRLERGIAWLLISLGIALLLAFGGYHAVLAFLEDTTTPGVVKIGTAVLVFGLAILLVSVVREKWFVRKTDKYREVVR